MTKKTMPSSHIALNRNNKEITDDIIDSFTKESIAVLAKRLDEDDYPTPFAALNDWHLLRAIAIHRPELTRPYLHLIDQEPFDEE